MPKVAFIFDHEMEALLEALRRDFRTEKEKAKTDKQSREWHISNARSAVRLLEALNPRGPERLMYRPLERTACVTSPVTYAEQTSNTDIPHPDSKIVSKRVHRRASPAYRIGVRNACASMAVDSILLMMSLGLFLWL